MKQRKPTKKQQRERIQRQADRLAYLAEGDAGVIRRTNMKRADKRYTDQYDRQAAAMVTR